MTTLWRLDNGVLGSPFRPLGNGSTHCLEPRNPLYKEILSHIKGIECAFIFDSFAKDEEKSHSDIDLIIIGDVGQRTLSSKFKEITDQTQREINPHVYSLKSWKNKLKKKDHFIKTITKNKKIFLIGDEDVVS